MKEPSKERSGNRQRTIGNRRVRPFTVAALMTVAILMSVAALTSVPALAQSGDGYDTTWNTIDWGGVMRSTGGDFELSGTMGQPDAGVMAGGDFMITGGFWFEIPVGDSDYPRPDSAASFAALERLGSSIGPGAVVCLCRELLPIRRGGPARYALNGSTVDVPPTRLDIGRRSPSKTALACGKTRLARDLSRCRE